MFGRFDVWVFGRLGVCAFGLCGCHWSDLGAFLGTALALSGALLSILGSDGCGVSFCLAVAAAVGLGCRPGPVMWCCWAVAAAAGRSPAGQGGCDCA